MTLLEWLKAKKTLWIMAVQHGCSMKQIRRTIQACIDEAKDHVSLKRLKEKMSHTLPQCGEDNSKERYRYMQWMSDNNAIKEAADE